MMILFVQQKSSLHNAIWVYIWQAFPLLDHRALKLVAFTIRYANGLPT